MAFYLGWHDADGSSLGAGQSGTLNTHLNNLLSVPTRRFSIPIAHPDQCTMLLQLAKINYFQEKREEALAKLATLQSRLRCVWTVQPGDPIYRAYAAAEPQMHLIPRPGIVAEKTVTSIEKLRAVLVEAEGLNRQLASQVDSYGHGLAYVPRGSYVFYRDLLKELFDGLKIAEDAHKLFHDLNQDQDARNNTLKHLKAINTHSIDYANKRITKVKSIMQAQEILARALDGQMKVAAQELGAAIKEVEHKIAALTLSLGINFMDLVEAATMICFCPNPYMVVTQAVGLGYKAYNKSGIVNDSGDVVSQDLLHEGFRSIESSATSLLSAYQEVKATKSELHVDGPQTTKLLAEKRDMEKVLKGFTKVLGKESLTKVSYKFQAYIDVTIRRNDVIMQYNNAANLRFQKLREVFEFEMGGEYTANPTDTSDSDLTTVSLFMERSYSRTLWAIMENLYMAERALRFWTLEEARFIQRGLHDNPASNTAHGTLSLIKDDLLSAYADAVESHGVKPSKFTGRRVKLDYDALEELKASRNTFVTIPPVCPWSTLDDSPFAGKCCVRLTTVRFFLEGATVQTHQDQ